MHLVINATEVGRRRGGNESFISGLIEGLAELHHSHRVSLLMSQWDSPPHLPSHFHQLNLGTYRRLPFLLWQQTIALRRLRADWYLANFFLPLYTPCHGAIMVYDLSFRAHPEYFPRTVAWYMHWLTARSIRQTCRVLTSSEFSRRELHRFYPVDEDKVAIVPGGVSPRFQPVSNKTDMAAEQFALSRYGITGPYILALGNIHPRKNLACLLDAYLRLRQERDMVPPMVWGGMERWGSGELLERARSAGVILPGFIAQEHLPILYRQAMMLVYPSLYEGFGLPPLEAMASGTPVITSNSTSLPEVVGDAGLTVDPNSVEEIADAMARVLEDRSLRQRLQQASVERARQFTWTNAARRLLETLES